MNQIKVLLMIIILILSSYSTLLAQEPALSTNAGSVKKAEFKMILEEKRKEASESLKLKQIEFQKKLQLIRDENKKAKVNRINEKIVDTNNRRTDKMVNSLEKLQTLLDRLAKKEEKARAKSIDTTVVQQSIAAADASIEIARNALINQAAKVYVIKISDEQTLKSEAQKTLLKMKSELLAVNELLIDAKQNVSVAVIETVKLKVKSQRS